MGAKFKAKSPEHARLFINRKQKSGQWYAHLYYNPTQYSSGKIISRDTDGDVFVDFDNGGASLVEIDWFDEYFEEEE